MAHSATGVVFVVGAEMTSKGAPKAAPASGMTAPHRLHDLADVLRLVREAALPRDFALQLDPYVRPKYEELWTLAQHPDEDY